MTDNEKLIEEAAKALDKNFNPDKHPIMAAMFRDYAATCLAVFENAHTPTDAPTQAAPALEVEGDAPSRATPTDDELEALSTLIAKIREGFYPEGLGAVSNDDLAHAILAAGFRRSVVPEPSAEPTKNTRYRWAGGKPPSEDRKRQGEPSDAQEAEIAARALDGIAAEFAKTEGLGLTSDASFWWSWFAETLSDKASMLRVEAAALRAAGVGGAQ